MSPREPVHEALDPIERCLQPEAMRSLLARVLPECTDGAMQIDALRVGKARRSASRRRNPNPLTLCYELSLRAPGSGRVQSLTCFGKVFRDGASARAAAGGAALHVAEVDMLLWRWPNDPGLPQLPRLLDPHEAQAWWGRVATRVTALRYEPERRATLRYSDVDDERRAWHAYAKTFDDDRGQAIHRRFVHFWDRAAHDPWAPTVARPLGYCEQTRTVWQDQADGVPLVEALRGGVDASLPARLAHAWAHLHAAPQALAGRQTRDAAHWLAEVQRRRSKISRVAPELADRVARVGDALERGAACLAAHPPGLIHGDCHPEQVWLAGTRVVLFDFDEFALGDPMEDLASFVVKLGALDRSGELVHALLRAYARLAPEQFDPRRLRWHAAVQQLLQASRAFVFQVPDWRAALERRLASAEALCARESGAARSASMPAQAAMLA